MRINKGVTYKLLTIGLLFILFIGLKAKPMDEIPMFQSEQMLTPNDSTEKDSVVPIPTQSWLETILSYDADDSIKGDLLNNRAFLYNNAVVDYGSTNLKAGYIEIDWNSNSVMASGIIDSSGKVSQKPVFTDNGKVFETDTIVYNFESQKARITRINTKEGESFIGGETVKRESENVYYISNTSFTTCSHRHPHFQVKTNKAKVIVGKQIVTGPAYLTFADIPTPLVLPFGFFPSQERRASGFIFPTFDFSSGNEINPGKGFGVVNGGYYWALSDYIDLKVTGDIYSRGGWGLAAKSNYVKRYKYNGNINLRYNFTKIGDPRYEQYNAFQESKDFRIDWTHRQDAKARPDLRFNARVNFATGTYNKYNTRDPNDYLQSTMASSISLDKNWQGTPWSMSLSANHSQNNQNQSIELSLPKMSLNMSRIMPFKRKVAVGSQTWFERIGVTYSMQGENRFSGNLDDFDTLTNVVGDLKYGLRHSAGISTNEKIMKFFSLSPSITYSSNWYLSKLDHRYDPDLQTAVTDTIQGFTTTHDFNMSANLSTKLYGMYNFKGKLKAIRHVMTPQASVSWRPDFTDESFGYYQEVQVDSLGNTQQRSRYQNYLYGGPSGTGGGSVNMSLLNILEGKTRSDNDSVGDKKFKILDRLNFSTSYNLKATKFAWSPLSVQAATKFLNNKLNVTYQGAWDFYGLDSAGNRVNKSAWEVNQKLLWNTRNNFSIGYEIRGKAKRESDKKVSVTGLTDGNENYYELPGFMNFVLPWSINFKYNYQTTQVGFDQNVGTHALGANIVVDPTPNWHLMVSTGYDLKQSEITYTTINITRDLHCWELKLIWVPFGFNQSYNIGINIKASQFKDVKYEQRRGIGDF